MPNTLLWVEQMQTRRRRPVRGASGRRADAVASPKNPDDIDIFALLAEVHGSSPEDLREGHVAQALNTLEATHRDAARGLRDLHTQGLRRARGTDAPQSASTNNGPSAAAARALPAHRPAADGSGTAVAKPGASAPLPSADAPPAAAPDRPNIAVQSGTGADVQMDHRTLTHIVRPNRGRR